MNKGKVSLLALIALILGVIYAAYVNYYFFVATPTEQDAAEAISEIIAGALVLPHIVVTCTAVLMLWGSLCIIEDSFSPEQYCI